MYFIKKKIVDTNIRIYGCKNCAQSDIVKEKIKQTNNKKYGVNYGFQNDEIKEKIKQTNIKKYGTENVFASEYGKNKIKETNNKKYGVDYIGSSKEIQEKIKQTNIEKYGVISTFSDVLTHEKIKQTNIEKYGVEWYCMIASKKSSHGSDSKPNLDFAAKLDSLNISYEREFALSKYVYDFKIGNILVEINPTITHNSYLNIFGNEPMSKEYHSNKTACANKNDYHCIHIWDWDKLDKIINILKPKETLYARNLELKEVSEKECNEFLNLYHLQNTCKGQTIRIGLYKDDVLIQIMTFGKPRYNKNYKWELLRLCTHKDYKVVGGAEKIFRYILDKYKPKSIISYCNASKFNGDVYIRLGFKLKNISGPGKHWYNIKTKQHITDNLLRQRGFDQLFNTNYGKGVSNEKLMLEYGFLPVYDCGQMVYVYK